MKVVFMGTPDFAVPSLRILVENGFEVVGVVTAPDRPAGRGLKLMESAVKQYAVSKELNVLQPEKLKNPEFLNELRELEADLFIVVAFRMLPEVVWGMPPEGTFNLHGSLLPQYRGAAPINWVIMNGEKETGLTTFFLQHEIDTGDIIDQTRLPIFENETAGELHDRMMEAGAELVLKTAVSIQRGQVETHPQQVSATTKKAYKIFKPDCRIDWSRDLDGLHNFIRGLCPYPTAWTQLDGKTVKIFRSVKSIESHNLEPGSIKTDGESYLHVACKGGFVSINELQLEGKKRMATEQFLRGARIQKFKMV